MADGIKSIQILSSTAEHPLTPAYKKGYYARTK